MTPIEESKLNLTLGPMSALDLKSLAEKMDGMIVPYQAMVSVEALHSAESRLRAKVCRADQVTEGPWRYLYLKIAADDVAKIKEELERRGLWVEKTEVAPDSFLPEYFCQKCDFRSERPGLCPQHQESLLEFSEWVAARNKSQGIAWRYVGVLAVGIFIAVIIYSATRQDGLFPLIQPLKRW